MSCLIALYTTLEVHLAQVERLQPVVRDRRANWTQSLKALQLAKASGARLTKSSIMLGCGEQPDEVLATFRALRAHGEHPLATLLGTAYHRCISR